MPYEIWRSLNAKQKLDQLEISNRAIVRDIWNKLNQLALERENFFTGSPEKIEVFMVGKYKIYYRILHRLKSIDVIDIIEII